MLLFPIPRQRKTHIMLMPGPNKLPQIMELVLKLTFLKHIFLIDVEKMLLSVDLDLALTSHKDMLMSGQN